MVGEQEQVSGEPRRGRFQWRPGDLGRSMATWAIASLALGTAGALLPRLSATSLWAWPIAALAAAVVGVLLRPVLVWSAAAIGWLGLVALAVVGQGVVIQAALWVTPGIHTSSFWTSLTAAWVAAVVSTFLAWIISAGTDESMISFAGRAERRRTTAAGAGADGPDELDGLVFVQLDGVPAPTLRWALEAGLMPTVRRWVGDGRHHVAEWTAQLPCTTPASQLGILHGTSAGVPAFRWFDRELGRVLVANRPADARIIEGRVSNGHGLLADDGASISNLFSGDATQRSMVLSSVEVSRGQWETRRALGWFLIRPDGFARTISRAVAEIGRERFQARRQRKRDVVPRVHRPWQFTGLRAVTNGLLRDVNLLLVTREMMRGRRSIYVNFVDYDEVAHHAGPMRLEALDVLTALDHVVAMLDKAAGQAARRYHVVLLSDHGQVLGTPFRQQYGEELAAVCRRLTGGSVAWEGEPVESWGRAASLAGDVAGEGSGAERAAGSVARRLNEHTAPGASGPASPGQQAEPVVLGSGSLGLFYSGESERLDLAALDRRWPELVDGLDAHPGVEFVAGIDADGVPWAIGSDGRIDLASGAVTGRDPLVGVPPHAARVTREALAMPEAPDLYVLGAVDAGTGEVTAFEDLAGSHGGLGGWQDRGMLVAPSALFDPAATGPIEGAAALHRVLVEMLERIGHRTGLASSTTTEEVAG